jgi:hypothetical protein
MWEVLCLDRSWCLRKDSVLVPLEVIAITMKGSIFWVVTPCSPIEVYRHGLDLASCFYRHDRSNASLWNVRGFHWITRCHVPEDSTLRLNYRLCVQIQLQRTEYELILLVTKYYIEILFEVSIKITEYWYVMPCSLQITCERMLQREHYAQRLLDVQ